MLSAQVAASVSADSTSTLLHLEGWDAQHAPLNVLLAELTFFGVHRLLLAHLLLAVY